MLRIEDTDKERNTEEALRVLLEGMRWLGLNWDEGPEVGGDYGPYFQSERREIYREYLSRLEATGRTYEKEGAIWFRLEGERYHEFDPHLKKEVEKVRAEPIVIEDLVRGKVERKEDRDFVLVRKSGEPVFHFVNVVDDIAMGITHVIRGEDHLSNTSKHCELFKAFGVEPPAFGHIPLILKSSGPGKMSKRDEGSLVEEYQKRHFLPEALRNYLCLLGWSPKDDREVLPINEVIQLFDLPQISKNNARFDEKKLSYINTEYLRAKPVETFAWLVRPILHEAGLIDESFSEDRLHEILGLCQPKIRSLEETPDFVRYFFTDAYEVEEKAARKVLKKGDPGNRLREFLEALESLRAVNPETLEELVNKLCEKHETGSGSYIQTVRLAVSGTNVGPGFYELVTLLGKETVSRRIRTFLAERFPDETSG